MRKPRFFHSEWVFLLISGFLMLGLAACKEKKPDNGEQPEIVSCPGLDSLYNRMDEIEAQLAAENVEWGSVKANLDVLHNELKTNLADEKGGSCYFLDNFYEREEDRFYFIELLTEVIIQQNLEDGILYLVKFRGLFIQDKEITEFISEDLAHVAYHNPAVYLSYLKNHSEQEEMLLNSTRWVTTDKETLIQSFDTLEGSEGIVKFLKERI